MKKKKTQLELPKNYKILLFSGIGAVLILFVGLAFFEDKYRAGFASVAIIVGFFPYSISSYIEKRRMRNSEDHFPDFLRDISESKKSGMTLPQALTKSARIDYGELTPEVKKMANQISWGVPFNEVLTRFSGRSKSKAIQRAIAIIIEAQMSGGAIADTLDSVARDAKLIKEAEKERKSKLSQQVMIMYAIFFLFIAIVISLQRLMVPLVFSKGFSITTENPEVIIGFYKNLFFSMVMIQAFFNGLLAGQIGEGSIRLGLRHSMIFLIAGIVVSWVWIF